jgi:rhamnose utilization protein RhaD (predicted bifunctional aldolase and dehydrogenase)
MTLDAPHLDAGDLSALKAMSARVGRDPLLIQGAGGNSSVKIDGVLWVKASGTWLQDAERAPIFLPVDLDLARQRFSAGEEKVAAMPWPSAPAGLRPSIETSLHAFLPQPIVLHVHSVNAIAWCIRAEGARALGDRLEGLNWAWLPYCRPGLPLATQAAALAARGRAPDVLLLGNHGLVVTGADTAATEALLAKVETRLHLDPRPAAPARTARLGGLAQGSPYRPAEAAVVHALATDPARCRIASGGSLYPDHVVFLGPGARILETGERPAELADQASSAGLPVPALLLAPGQGVLLRKDLPPEAVALAECLGEVLARLPDASEVTYLGAEEEQALLGWDAEKYRKNLQRPG